MAAKQTDVAKKYFGETADGIVLTSTPCCSQPISSASKHDPLSELRLAQHLYWLRRERDRIFGRDSDLFGEPAWDMLLDLFIAGLKSERVNVSSACFAASVPHATAIRWLGSLERRGLVFRNPDHDDRRRIYVRLSGRGIGLVRQWLQMAELLLTRPIDGEPAT